MTLEIETLYADCERSLKAAGVSGLESLQKSTLLIVGASGFVGLWLSTLAAYLNDKHAFGIRIVGIARRKERIAQQAAYLLSRDDYEFRQSDVRQIADLPPEVSWIINAAGSPDNRQHATDPISTMSTFAGGTDRILRLAERAAKLRAILHFSSSTVYDGAGGVTQPYKEASITLDALSAYGEAKRYSEVLCAAFRTQARLPIVITRPFTLIGPFQPLDAPWAVNHFLHAALNGQPLKVQGSGESIRALLYGSDMAVLALRQLVGGDTGAVYNLGGTVPLALRAIADLVVLKSGRLLEVRYNTSARPVPLSVLAPDMSRSVSEFDFEPAFSASDAIARTLQWHSRIRN